MPTYKSRKYAKTFDKREDLYPSSYLSDAKPVLRKQILRGWSDKKILTDNPQMTVRIRSFGNEEKLAESLSKFRKTVNEDLQEINKRRDRKLRESVRRAMGGS